ncbi:2-pyrone-4,6-dicarboxylate hydrolase [Hypericibacter adhaerens]|uniref:2-pyrone-4,6-dicarboxylate hydrolase n=1 Tax=Hypericibacter adhaerens TaxID=2602016 RepID=A0A5J6N4I0_9PROT|nr:amidohydrolase family protein [Hypericibacter adhaerens]QEX24741.1 2-pyrone-4,6-dicarboxylate hydrolase [Hypericibacter adhaerens]
MSERSKPVPASAGGIVDCHLHIVDAARFPFTPGVGYTPQPGESGTREELASALSAAGVTRAVLVQPSCYAFDNAAMLDAMASSAGRYKGIAVVNGDESDRALEKLAERGVVGVRFNLGSFDGAALSRPDAPALLSRIKARDWFAQVHARDDQWRGVAPLLLTSGVKIVVDHFGIGDPDAGLDAPGFRSVLDLGRGGHAVLKLSAPFRMVSDPDRYDRLDAHVERLFRAFGEDMRIWGSDWPFLAIDRKLAYETTLGFLRRWLPDAADRDRVLWRNPSRLFGFAE